MKKLVILFVFVSAMSCSDSKTDEAGPQKKVVCADSFDQELFDTLGNPYTVRMPGDCDTVLVDPEK